MTERFEHRKTTGSITLTLSNKEKWTKDKGQLCEEVLSIIARYAKQGYTLTLRQLYYQLVASGCIRNDDVVYKKMSSILDDLRYSGKVAWDAIEDRGRVPYMPYWVEDIADAIKDTVSAYRLDRQKGQPTVVEVWTEKDAISGILKRATNKYQIRLVVNKGYSSSSAMHLAYSRFAKVLNGGKDVTILYFGDHDPSGLDMLRDIKDRILFFIAKGDQVNTPEIKGSNDFYTNYFENEIDGDFMELVKDGFLSEKTYESYTPNDENEDRYEKHADEIYTAIKMHYWATRFKVIPMGLTMNQIKEYNPPPNPAKLTDPRSDWYIKEFGQISWEVDALSPNVMSDIVMQGIEEIIDYEMFEAMVELEKSHQVSIDYDITYDAVKIYYDRHGNTPDFYKALELHIKNRSF